jgi:glycosidase
MTSIAEPIFVAESAPNSVAELDLSPLPGKVYWDVNREWREDFIYFLMVDRFHDDRQRTPHLTAERAESCGTSDQLGRFCGGTLKGVLQHLDYIAGLGCTAIWLSPVFENNEASYHGYAIQNYLAIDPRFGTKQDLVDLVTAAHERDMRVYLDIVMNHSGDNWSYLNENPNDPYRYWYDMQFDFGAWRREDRPVPIELRNPNFYHRRGQIQDWNNDFEAQRGDFMSLKDYNNDETPDGLALQDALIKAHCYWIREADIDGFRLDACKHFGALVIERFCSAIREYAESLGKRHFFLFGELVADDNAIDRYIGPNTVRTGSSDIYYGLTSALDFPLYWVLPSALKGLTAPSELISRYNNLNGHAINRGELGRYLVTFLDNHDQIGQSPRRRFGAESPDEQVIGGVGFLLCALGTTCLYYGTEQGFSGEGDNDCFIREPLFDLNDTSANFLNPDCRIYKQIATIAAVVRSSAALRFGRMYFRQISGNLVDFGLPMGNPCTLAFSRILAGEEVLVVYNTSTTETRSDGIVVDSHLQRDKGSLTFLYGGDGRVPLQLAPDQQTRYVQLTLKPMQFVILK